MSEAIETFLACFKDLLHASLPPPELKVTVPSADYKPKSDAARPCALILSPHPDDECLTGALPLRLKREANWQIINVAVTLGSKAERKAERWKELANACAILGFEMLQPVPGGETTAASIAELIRTYKPQAVFLPHARDAHPAHMRTHQIGMDALAQQDAAFACHVAQTEYWQPNDTPSCMVGLSDADTALLLKALCCHVGENSRNPFHLRFPTYLADTVRRGSERVMGKGVAAAPLDFAMLYDIRRWKDGRLESSGGASVIMPAQSAAQAFGG